jgi:hypothetical protein
MAYEYEHDEWNRAMRGMSETEHAATEVDLRHSAGMVGDRDDAYDK